MKPIEFMGDNGSIELNLKMNFVLLFVHVWMM